MSATAVHTSPLQIVEVPSVDCVRIPLLQHQGKAAAIIVQAGQFVCVGQPLTHSDHLFEVPVHASISGTVQSVDDQHICIVKNEDDQPADSAIPTPHTVDPFTHLTRAEFTQQFHSAGLVGLGGSAYPVAAKLNKLGNDAADVLLINAAECDPLIQCDEALLSSCLEEVALGICLAQLATRARRTIIAAETDKLAVAESLLQRVCELTISEFSESTALKLIPAQYPNGAETLLMSYSLDRRLSARDIHQSKLITFNVGTCHAMFVCLLQNKPYTHRIATVIDHEQKPVTRRLPLGLPLRQLTTIAEFSAIVGGEMMGREAEPEAVVSKASNCIQFLPLAEPVSVRPCVRCGLCVDACPVQLMPQYLLAATNPMQSATLQTLNVDDCIGCACCDRVCPSHIPLAQLFTEAQHYLRTDQHQKRQAELAKQRFEKRQARLDSSMRRQFKKLDDKQTQLNQTADQQAKRKLVEAALQRAKNKKANPSDSRNNSNSNSNSTAKPTDRRA